jgi:hypothetical protein
MANFNVRIVALFHGAVVIKYSLEALNLPYYRYATFTLIQYFQDSWKLQPRVLKIFKMIKLHISKSCKVLWCKLALNKAFMTYIERTKYITLFRVLLDVLTKSMREECLIYF